MKLWLTLQTLGTDQLSDMVTHGIDLAERAESMLRNQPENQPEWEVVTPAQLAIVNFRYAPRGIAHHRGRIYRLGGFCYFFRRIGGAGERHALLTDFSLPVCSGNHPGCVFTQQVSRSGWRLECVLDHGSDYCDHFPCHLPQGNHRPVTAARKPCTPSLLHRAG